MPKNLPFSAISHVSMPKNTRPDPVPSNEEAFHRVSRVVVVVVVVSESESCVCMSTPHTRATQLKGGLSKPRSCPAQEHKPRHPDALALPWHQPDTDRNDPEASVSSKHVAETESPKHHVLRGVQEFFCLVGLF